MIRNLPSVPEGTAQGAISRERPLETYQEDFYVAKFRHNSKPCERCGRRTNFVFYYDDNRWGFRYCWHCMTKKMRLSVHVAFEGGIFKKWVSKTE